MSTNTYRLAAALAHVTAGAYHITGTGVLKPAGSVYGMVIGEKTYSVYRWPDALAVYTRRSNTYARGAGTIITAGESRPVIGI